MKKLVLDTNILIAHWRTRYVRPQRRHRTRDAERWAKELIKAQATNAIVTPVYIEMVCGTRTAHEASLTRTYLEQFQCVDGKNIPSEVWQSAIRMAGQATGRARDLGDCLIRAIADRLNYEVRTEDKSFPT